MKQHLRQEKNCLNCGTIVGERYCTHCGQENVETRESFGHLLNHFFADLTHYDSKFFVTLKDLLFRPGFLSREYREGRRTSYLHPIRMYVFISAIYFLVFLTRKGPQQGVEEGIAGREVRKEMADSLYKIRSTGVLYGKTGKTDLVKDSILSSIMTRLDMDSTRDLRNFDFQVVGGITYKHLRAYDSAQRLLPPEKRDGGLVPWLYHRWLTTINRYGRYVVYHMSEKMLHALPKLMFLLLPLFALLLKLFYSRKKYFYADHAIFALHFHCAVFLIFLVFDLIELAFPHLSGYTDLAELGLVFVYLVAALRNAYLQSFPISILKGVVLTIIYSCFILAGFAIIALTYLL